MNINEGDVLKIPSVDDRGKRSDPKVKPTPKPTPIDTDSPTNEDTHWWHSDIARAIVPDMITMSVDANFTFGIGSQNSPIEITILTRGEPGVVFTTSWGLGGGVNMGADIAFGSGNFTGNPKDITMDGLQGNYFYGSIGGSFGLKADVDVIYAPGEKGDWVIGKVGLGVGGPSFVAVSGGKGETGIIEFGKPLKFPINASSNNEEKK
jgi:hypothetical protein